MEQDGIFEQLPKKEVIKIRKEYDKLNKYLCGIRNVKKVPEAVVIVDPHKEINAIKEARRLHIPVFGLVDTNCDPDLVDYVIPANDDAIRSVKLILGVLNNAVAEVVGAPLNDYVTDEDRKEKKKPAEKEIKEEKSEDKPKKEVKKEEPVEEKLATKEVEEEIKVPKKVAKTKEETKKPEEKKVKTVKKEKAVKEEKIDLTKLTVVDLKKMAKEKNIEGYSKMKKDELIKSLK